MIHLNTFRNLVYPGSANCTDSILRLPSPPVGLWFEEHFPLCSQFRTRRRLVSSENSRFNLIFVRRSNPSLAISHIELHHRSQSSIHSCYPSSFLSFRAFALNMWNVLGIRNEYFFSVSFTFSRGRLLISENGENGWRDGGEKVLETFELITTLYDSRWTHEEIRLVLAVGVKVELLMDDHGATI